MNFHEMMMIEFERFSKYLDEFCFSELFQITNEIHMTTFEKFQRTEKF